MAGPWIWTPDENKIFEVALANFGEDTPDRWDKVAACVPGKTAADVISHYLRLLADLHEIETGRPPCYPSYSPPCFSLERSDKQHIYGFNASQQLYATAGPKHDRKGVPWTIEEHKLFLVGLNKYGKGDWRNISRHFVATRTPTQVASHAQKYFIRMKAEGKDKRRSSIHDITTAYLSVDLPSSSTSHIS
ncbi:hypothetical protein Cni_G13438 [Canna indica]|uniref:Transcription factor MYBS1 n=1 Tax=Canna indica TaxID=4628 RepID=A0AAQ3Q9U6_9LILI|nr:hypothetical protein Cni_G13438 [Canna indica]